MSADWIWVGCWGSGGGRWTLTHQSNVGPGKEGRAGPRATLVPISVWLRSPRTKPTLCRGQGPVDERPGGGEHVGGGEADRSSERGWADTVNRDGPQVGDREKRGRPHRGRGALNEKEGEVRGQAEGAQAEWRCSEWKEASRTWKGREDGMEKSQGVGWHPALSPPWCPNPASKLLTRTLHWALVGMVGMVWSAYGETACPPLGPPWAGLGAEGICGLLRPGRGKAPSTSVGKMTGETCLICMRLVRTAMLIGG